MTSRNSGLEAELARRLAAAVATGSPNRVTTAELRDWALEYLGDHDEEVRKFPKEASQPHWNLWMMDTRFEDALFAVLIFKPEALEFFCGTGDSFAIRHFCGQDFPDDPDELFQAMRERFNIPEESLPLNQDAAENWLGRKW